MVTVHIGVQSTPTTDSYLRSHWLSIDQLISWKPDRQYRIGYGQTGFVYSEAVDLPVGEHPIYYLVSGYVPKYAWHAKLYVNNELIAEGDVGRNTPLEGVIQITPTEEVKAKPKVKFKPAKLLPLLVLGAILFLAWKKRK